MEFRGFSGPCSNLARRRLKRPALDFAQNKQAGGHRAAQCTRQFTPTQRGHEVPDELIELNLDVHARGKLQLHEGIHRLVGGIQDVHEPLMRSQLELVARILIGVR